MREAASLHFYSCLLFTKFSEVPLREGKVRELESSYCGCGEKVKQHLGLRARTETQRRAGGCLVIGGSRGLQ